MTDTQDNRPKGGWQEPTISASVFIEPNTRITVDPGNNMSGGTWLDFKGEHTMTSLKICFQDEAQVIRLRDALSVWIKEYAS